MTAKRIQIIVDLVTAKQSAAKLLQSLKPAVDVTFGDDYELHIMAKGMDVKSVTRDKIEQGARQIVAIGGRNTLPEVVNGFFRGKKLINPNCELGIVCPHKITGLPQTMDLPQALIEQLVVLKKPYRSKVDVGCITYFDKDRNLKERLFVNEFQMGIGSRILSKSYTRRYSLKEKLLFEAYAFFRLLNYQSRNYDLKFNGDTTSRNKLMGVVVGNGSHCSGGIQLTPNARPNNGYFDVLLIQKMGLKNRITEASKTQHGTHLKSDNFIVRHEKSLSIDAPGDLQIEADGQMLGYAPCKIEMLSEKLLLKTGFKIASKN